MPGIMLKPSRQSWLWQQSWHPSDGVARTAEAAHSSASARRTIESEHQSSRPTGRRRFILPSAERRISKSPPTGHASHAAAAGVVRGRGRAAAALGAATAPRATLRAHGKGRHRLRSHHHRMRRRRPRRGATRRLARAQSSGVRGEGRRRHMREPGVRAVEGPPRRGGPRPRDAERRAPRLARHHCGRRELRPRGGGGAREQLGIARAR